ncbi:formylmethanofuran dehydrogenase subunit C [Azohydromonas lata]|uniref:Formylmethanofuran dehydrogenase subunit C n=1 Tax=Azohydromonas lata TaxID=45677 RepID=A0ABU5IIB0_9BURK|nr:formylmethanofuran dehydrogenase subunit C [Azohydromonas lata]MDZ5458226.1 formylmethanofuran dehydrogenase subunit C [Azohydromonas lata]
MTWTLTLLQPPALRLDLRSLVPQALAGMDVAAVETLPLWQGRQPLPLAEFFKVVRTDDGAGDSLVFEGDLSRCDRIGWQMAAGRIAVRGSVGDLLGTGLSGGEITVAGHAGELAGCEMQGGRITVQGNVGDFAAAPLPGSMEGVKGGVLLVQGRAGARLADRMRRGLVLVHGGAGDFAASRLVAGTVAVGGALGAHAGFQMRRGTLLCAGGCAIEASPNFIATRHDVGVIWQLLARSLVAYGGAFAGLPSRRVRRLAGDLATGGRGEILLPG